MGDTLATLFGGFAWAGGLFVWSRLWVVHGREYHRSACGRRGVTLIAADQLLLVGDELDGLLPGERERGPSPDPGTSAPLAHRPARGAEPVEALQRVRPGGRAQSRRLRLCLDAQAIAGDPDLPGRGFPPPLPAMAAAGDLAHEVVLGQQPQVVAGDPAVLA